MVMIICGNIYMVLVVLVDLFIMMKWNVKRNQCQNQRQRVSQSLSGFQVGILKAMKTIHEQTTF